MTQKNDDLIIGIDLGTTNSLVGVVDSGFPILLADGDGQRLTPSVVHYPKDATSPPLVGKTAARMRAVAPGRTIASVKRFMGRRREDLAEDDVTDLGYTVESGDGDWAEIALDDNKRLKP
ncbi:MAG: Hsp70 family protein, partial [Verrucomicrobiae bacterium]|nr:Hsp70 family protein [Verrucomicrobiae bacterium]